MIANVHSNLIAQNGAVVGDCSAFDLNTLALGQIQARHDHVDVTNDNIACNNDITLGSGVDRVFVDQFSFCCRLGIRIFR